MLRTLLLDPLTIKELSGVARRWQSYVSRMLYVGLIGIVVYIVWLQIGRMAQYLSPSESAEMGRSFFYGFGAIQLLFATLTGVSAASDLITREVRGGTLGLLSLTPLTTWRIAAGKWKAALAQALMLILCGVPVLAVCVFLGGIGAWELLWSTSLTVASAALGAAIALLCSAWVRTGTAAILLTLAALFLANLLPGLLAAPLGIEVGFTALAHVQPHYAYVTHSIAMETGGAFDIGGRYAWISATAASFLAVAGLLRMTASRIETLLRTPPGGPSILARTFDAMDQFAADVSPRPLRKVWAVGGGRVWERHAILWKELRTRAASKLRNGVRLGLGIVLLFLLPLSCLMTEGRGWAEPMLWMAAVLLLFMAMSNGAGLFVQEKEEKKWDVLLSTPLTAGEIIRAKLLAGAVPLLPVSIFLAGLYAVMGLVRGIGYLPGLLCQGSIALSVAFAYVLGAWASLRGRNLRSAFSLTFGIILVAYAIVPMLAGLLLLILADRPGWDDFPLVLIQMTNPAPFIEPYGDVMGRSWEDSSWKNRVDDRCLQILPYFAVYAALHAGMTLWLLVSMRLGFRKITGRA